jgi:prepilin-type processing-associated H-X9-DG protein
MNIQAYFRDRARVVVSQRRASKGRSFAAGFTAIELVAVIAALGLLAAILLPSLSYARNEARTLTCQDRLFAFGQALQTYVNANQDYIPGVNTSGVATRAKNGIWGALNPHTIPVQSYDWMTPLLQADPSLPDNRAARFQYLYAQYACPEQTRQSVLYQTGLNMCLDKADFLAYPSWPASSYLMPQYFSLWGTTYNGWALARKEGSSLLVTAACASPSWEVLNTTYSSHLSQVGPPASKIFVADGTRYMDANGLIDTDVQPEPQLFGAFASGGGWWCGGTEYGVKSNSLSWDGRHVNPGSPAQGQNLPASYRHRSSAAGGQAAPSGIMPLHLTEVGDAELINDRTLPARDGTVQGNNGYINAVYFDGHVETLNDRQSREISLWYPTGSIVQASSEGLTYAANGTVIP